jgi:hypothetical protein
MQTGLEYTYPWTLGIAALLRRDKSLASEMMPLPRYRPRAATEHGPMITRMVVQQTLWLAAMGAILFLAAGDWRWPQGWVFLGELGLSSFAVNF